MDSQQAVRRVGQPDCSAQCRSLASFGSGVFGHTPTRYAHTEFLGEWHCDASRRQPPITSPRAQRWSAQRQVDPSLCRRVNEQKSL